MRDSFHHCEWNFLPGINGVVDVVDSAAIAVEDVAYTCDVSVDVDVLFNRIGVNSAERKILST